MGEDFTPGDRLEPFFLQGADRADRQTVAGHRERRRSQSELGSPARADHTGSAGRSLAPVPAHVYLHCAFDPVVDPLLRQVYDSLR
jgi:hypothetical protein